MSTSKIQMISIFLQWDLYGTPKHYNYISLLRIRQRSSKLAQPMHQMCLQVTFFCNGSSMNQGDTATAGKYLEKKCFFLFFCFFFFSKLVFFAMVHRVLLIKQLPGSHSLYLLYFCLVFYSNNSYDI